MKPLFSFCGGKQRMASKIVKLLPRHTVYVEPYCGGAAVFFAKPWPPVTNNDHYREILNDLNGHIINLYRVVQDPKTFSEFQRLVNLPYSRQVFSESRAILHNSTIGVEAAAAYWLYTSMAFGNSAFPLGSWGIGKFGRSLAVTHISKIARLSSCLNRLFGVVIENEDALNIIKRWDSPQTLFYCDPPYVNTEQKYKHKSQENDLQKLCQALNTCKGSFLLSGYPNEIANSFMWDRVDFQAKTSADINKSGDKRRTECVWRVDRSDTARPEIQAIWKKWEANGFRWNEKII